MVNFIARFLESLPRFLFLSGERRSSANPAQPTNPLPRQLRSSLAAPLTVFVRGCLRGPSGEHRLVFLPYRRTEYERWQRAVNRQRRQGRRELWLGLYEGEVA
ncbi:MULTISPECIES: hypothetical protein [unclassified Streptomyces]|uniref:hypothetical protein n=1 Tax=unclassified Streptomyces TaxID=2593676 RepID=UPI00382E10E0